MDQEERAPDAVVEEEPVVAKNEECEIVAGKGEGDWCGEVVDCVVEVGVEVVG